jgi:hypothetical protein
MKKLVIVCSLIAFALLGWHRPASAQWAVTDPGALTQRATQFVQYLIQFNELIRASRGYLAAFQDAYKGLKEWNHLGWEDTLRVLDMPWFDGVDGIDDIRRVSYLSMMSVQQIQDLWANRDPTEWTNNPRYKNDPWYRAKVNSLVRQSKRAKATRTALLRQMQGQNAAMTNDIERIKRLRDRIEAENKKDPVNQALVTSLQAELQAIEAKHQQEGLMMANQRAIIDLVGSDDAQRVYLETRDRGWISKNQQQLIEIGRGISR